MARQTLTLDDLGKKYGNDRQKDFPHGDNRNFNNRNNRRGNNHRNSHSGNNLYHGTPQTAARQSNIEKATAPYNFVALPENVLPSEIASVEDFKNHIQNCGKISGEIELEIETLTPIFLGGNDKTSFAPAGKFIIPGSSLRGMFKNIFKIVTCGAFRGRTDSQKKGEDFNDEHIYYRCLMGVRSLSWTKDLNSEYNSRMVGTIRGADGQIKPAKNARPGFLIQTFDNKYFIAPSIHEHDKKDDRIFIKEYEQKFNTKIALRNSSCVEWHGREAYIITGSNKFLYDKKSYEKLTDDQKKKAGKQFIRFTSIDYVDWSENHKIELPDDVRESYEHDRNRRGVNLFTDKGILKREQLEKLCKNLPDDVKTLIPCHFLYEDNRVTAFGHGQCFRIPYKNAIGDVVPQNLQDEKTIDFAEAIFGSKENWASRVFFEDAMPISEIETLETAAAHPLMQPNPTSYQLYLVQDDDETLTHWDKNNVTLRGYKLYWHNDKWDWLANDSEKQLDADKTADKRITKDLTPLKEGSKFKSKIRFQNLSAVELGALMMIFDLNGAKNPAYKIGMGKPLGLGSIKIKPQLYIENSDAYTGEIFDSEGFKSPYKASESQTYIKVFKDYINAQIGLKSWQKIMDELNAILDWENKPDSKKIAPMGNVPNERGQMDLDERLKQRVPLPNIFDVK